MTHEPPQHDVAVIGGGQLARMMQPPAIGLGIRLTLLAEGPDVSAAQAIADHHIGTHTDLDDLRRAVQDAPVVTFDHEHVPPEHLRTLVQEGHDCRPGPDALIHAQDKLVMRRRLTDLGVPCPRWAPVAEPADVEAFGFPAIVKTARGGYDGKGVWKVESAADLDEPFGAEGALLVEELVPFRRELSAQVARSATGEIVDYPVVESRQVDGVCFEVIAPAPNLDPVLEARARSIARTIAEALDVVGMLAVELFETNDDRILVNELAMRPHNTGHWSIDGAVTSQFENHLRAVMGLPLGSTTPRQPWSVMVNILGGAVEDLAAQREVALAAQPDVKVHLYGKAVKPGRKVGHVTAVGDELEDVLRRARRSAALLTDGDRA
ncbi:5-(carboxyamino)imidazole ribonucleotide synthase [Aeromicrobium duanguangcaii]|uniref:N5-carboxyaminoimidazole ribonucleotide synthase n=1 Tax=Aeromicrobium duanguangcaii TaxID=2968086 RepID=A0ABY5KDR7_9ACTN|nr:5-(carboxyamino)imidazole ribonucleotide synthase [Aeromicrobium duanguangcaii]UUI68010.1 5-(carboxyamino)imidazole ribonucleotide synthase [Aeromicrobium duanguangcaii]